MLKELWSLASETSGCFRERSYLDTSSINSTITFQATRGNVVVVVVVVAISGRESARSSSRSLQVTPTLGQAR